MRTIRKICMVGGMLGSLVGVSLGQTVAKVESELLEHINKLEKVSNYAGNSDEIVQEKENDAIRAVILKSGKRGDVLAYSFPKLKEKMTIVTSPDGKLRTYSWDTESGGTMHDFVTVWQFRRTNGRVGSWALPYSSDIEGRGAGAFVTQIFQTQAPGGAIYLTTSTFIGSTSLSGQFIGAVRISRDGLDLKPKAIRTAKGLTDSIGFEYDFFSVVDRPERPIKLVSYDSTANSFRFPVVINDEKMPQGRVTGKFITYKFNGRYFVKVS